MSSHTKNSLKQSESHDVLTYYPNLLKLIDGKKMKLLSDSKYAPLALTLKKGPMTIRDLESAYKKVAGVSKSEKTLYRYLKVLIEAGLVTTAGQRVVVGRRVNETLYTLTARIFYSPDEHRFECTQKEKNMMLFLLTDVLGIRTLPNEDLEYIFSSWRKSRKETIAKLAAVTECDELRKLTSDVDPDWASCLIDDVALIAWLFTQSGLSVQTEELKDD